MKTETCSIICIVLAFIVIFMIGRAAMNDGKLWDKEENYRYVKCSSNSECRSGKCDKFTDSTTKRIFGKCV